MSTEALLKLIKERKASVTQVRTSKPPLGRSRWRLLPGWRPGGDPTFYHDFGQHFVKNAANEVVAVYICTDKTFGRPCQICQLIGHGIKNSTDDMTKKRLEAARASGRVLANALHIDGPNPTQPVVLEMAPMVFNGKKGVGGIISLFEEWPTLLNPADGHDIIIEKQGAGLDTSYGVSIAGGSKPVPVDALTKLHDLDKFVQMESETAARRALTSVASISGLLPPPAAMVAATVATAAQPVADRPMTVVSETAPVVAPVAVVTAPIVVASVTAVAATPAPIVGVTVAAPAAPIVTPAAPAVVAVPAIQSTGDAELDALLNGLGK